MQMSLDISHCAHASLVSFIHLTSTHLTPPPPPPHPLLPTSQFPHYDNYHFSYAILRLFSYPSPIIIIIMSTPPTPPSAPPPRSPSPPLTLPLPPLLQQQQQLQTRKVPPPCWTHEEILALIESYRDRWIALRRGYLRTADWDSVASAVSAKCHHLSLSVSKTSAQCRHKIEKLRQRYRAERQRCVSFPGKFFSSWIFFKKLDFIDDGASPAAGSDLVTVRKIGIKGKSRVKSKSVIDTNLIDTGFVDGGGSNPNGNFHHDLDGVVDGNDGFSAKMLGARPSVFIRSKNYVKTECNSNNSAPTLHSDHGVRTGFYVNSLDDRSILPLPGFKAKKSVNLDRNFTSNIDFNHENSDGFDVRDEFLGKHLGDHNPIPLRIRSQNYNYINGSSNPYFHVDQSLDDEVDIPTEYRTKSGNWHSVPPVFRSKYSYNFHGDTNSKLDPGILNGSSINKLAQRGDGGGMKREMDPVLEIASSIKLLGEGFIKMEKMKMDMAMEIEKMRMEMDMKRNEMILESQRQTVDAFLKVLLKKNKKAKVTVSPES